MSTAASTVVSTSVPAAPAGSWSGQVWLCALGIGLLGIALRAIASALEGDIFNDGPVFISAAESLARGDLDGLLRSPQHPVTSSLIAALSASTTLDPETAGRVLSVGFGGAAGALLYGLARDQFGARIALVAGLLFAIHPRLIATASNVQSDGIYLFPLLLAAWLAWRALEAGRTGAALGAGLACGLAFLTRPEGVSVGVVLLAWLGLDALCAIVRWCSTIATVSDEPGWIPACQC